MQGQQNVKKWRAIGFQFYFKDYAIRRDQVNQDGLKLNGTYQLFLC